MASHKLLYICQQVAPYLKDIPQAELTRDLIQAMQERGNEIRTFMPKYGCINERRNQLHEVIRLSGMNLIIDDTDHQLIIKVASIPSARVQIYFIDNDDYFARKAVLYDEDGAEFADNDERAIFFSRGVLETVKKLRWEPTIIHCHGWFSAIAPAYLKEVFGDDPIFSSAKVVVTVDSYGFKSPLEAQFIEKIKGEEITGEAVDYLSDPTYENLYRFVLEYADGIVIGSETIDEKIMEAIRQSGKPTLEYQDPAAEDFFDNYNNFYGSL
ncbi:MAG: glycogen/starch synthase [Rikenellaceae bacterium]